MKILNIMLSRGTGGLENASLRYSDALSFLGHDQLNILDERSKLLTQFDLAPLRTLRQRSEWDLRAIWQLHKIIAEFQPDIILTHGNRANRLAARANCWHSLPQVAVLHRFRFKGLAKYDGVFCVSRGLQKLAIQSGLPKNTTRFMPNMLTPPNKATPKVSWHKPPIIGFLGRFVPEKGTDILLDALAILQQNSTPFRAIIAGSGRQERALKQQASALDLNDSVTFLGWSDDIADFFKQIDILIMPSRHESFGLVILEAWQHNCPIIATKTTGSTELIQQNISGILCQPDAQAIASAYSTLQATPETVKKLCKNGQKSVQDYYIENLAPRLDSLLKDVLEQE